MIMFLRFTSIAQCLRILKSDHQHQNALNHFCYKSNLWQCIFNLQARQLNSLGVHQELDISFILKIKNIIDE